MCNVLPLVERELRHASRRRLGFLVRIAAALLGAIFGTFYLLGSESNGRNLFIAVAHIAFAAAALSGVFLTADSLRSEIREGTLGLLFLARLSGIDIVLGKLASNGINALLALLALLPVFALSLLLGGVSGAELSRVAATLLITLVFSLSIGLAVSASGENQARAVLATAVWLLILTFGCHQLSLVTDRFGALRPGARIFAWNPWDCFLDALSVPNSAKLTPFLLRFGGTCAGSMAILAFASWQLPRHWVDHFSGSVRSETRLESIVRGMMPRTRMSHPSLVDQSPVAALVSDAPKIKWISWAASIAGAMMTLNAFFLTRIRIFTNDPGMDALFVNIVGVIVIIIAVAWQSSQFFLDAKRSGWLEILATMPLRNSEFLDGQWKGMRQIFLGPCLLISLNLWLLTVLLNVYLPMVLLQGDLCLNLLVAARAGAWFGLSNSDRGRAFLKTIAVVALPKMYWMCFLAEPIYLTAMILESHARFRLGVRWLAGGVSRDEFLAEVARRQRSRPTAQVPAPDSVRRP